MKRQSSLLLGIRLVALLGFSIFVNGASDNQAKPKEISTEVIKNSDSVSTPRVVSTSKLTLETVIKPLSSKVDLDKAIAAKGPKVFKFYADWCGPCKMIQKDIATVALKYAEDVAVYAVNADSGIFTDFLKQYAINSLPTILFLPSGRKMVGISTQAEYEKAFLDTTGNSQAKKIAS